MQEERPEFSRDTINTGDYLGNTNLGSLIHEVSYWGKNTRAVNPWSYKLSLEQQSYEDAFEQKQSYLKLSAEWKGEYTYDQKKAINLRLFVGGFLNNSRKEAGNFYDNVSNRSTRGTMSLSGQGFVDEKYDDFYFGRNEDHGIWSGQVAMRDGGMKYALGSSYGLGLTNSFMLAANLKADLPQELPFKLPLKPYLDFAYFKNATPLGQDATFNDQFLWSGGVMLEMFDGNGFVLVGDGKDKDAVVEQQSGK